MSANHVKATEKPNEIELLTNGSLIYAAVGAICVLLWAVIAGWPGDMSAISYQQERLDTAIGAPNSTHSIEFEFIPHQDGLNAVEVVLVNFAPDDPAASGSATITLENGAGDLIASRQLISSKTAHNHSVRLDFDPIRTSGSQKMTLRMTGSEQNQLSMWGYSVNVWPDSTLTGGGEAETLHMTTRYAFRWSTAPVVLLDMFGRFWAVILVSLLYIPLPGALLFTFWPNRDQNLASQPLVRLSLIIGLGVSIWPLIWHWSTVIGLRFSGPILWGLIVLGWGAVLFFSYRRRGPNEPFIKFNSELISMLLFLFAIFLIRLLAIRDMAFLPWVDSSRHALITAIMRDSGQFLTTYEPYLPISWSGYHYGFHTLSAGIALLLGDRVSLPDLLLPLMQLLSTLTTLAVFGSAVLITGRRSVGWIAAVMLALPFLFPGYYTTWGRLTQISGMIVLPLLVGVLMAPLNRSADSKVDSNGKPWLPFILVVGPLLTAGLFLLHARVFFYFIPFGLILGGYYLIRWVQTGRQGGVNRESLLGGPLGQLTLIAFLSGLLVIPRIWSLLTETTYIGVGVVQGAADRPLLSFPTGYVTAGWERWFWLMAGLALILALVNRMLLSSAKADLSKADQWVRSSGILVGWLGLLYLMTAGPSLHPSWPILLPQSSVNSAYIAAFATQAILIGISVLLIYQIALHFHRLASFAVIALIGAGMAATLLFGVHNQITILNQTTILGKPADVAAIEWIEENTAKNAKIANNAWVWLNSIWAGTDGAAWITPMTGRLTGTPPIDHIYNSRLFGITSAFNQSADQIDDWSDPEAIMLLQQNGFTHIFTGVSDGAGAVDMDPAELLRNPAVDVVFSADGVYVFEILAP